MLYRTLHMPGLYSYVPSASAHALSHCALLIHALLDAERNCVILIDGKTDIQREMAAGISRWPIKHRKRGQELFERLKKRKRFCITSESGFSQPFTCFCPNCLAACRISGDPDIYMILAKNECATCASLPRSIVLEDYAVSTYNEERCKGEKIQLNDGEWAKSDFEDKVWKPLFRHVKKRARLFDRYIGRTMKRSGGSFRLKTEFENSLDWILEQFASFHRGKSRPSFEIHTAVGMDGTDGARDPRAAAQHLRDWAANRSIRYGVKVIMHVKREQINYQMKKSRFVITDQIALSISHGTDLLRRDNRIRSIEIHSDLEPNKIINDFFNRLASV